MNLPQKLIVLRLLLAPIILFLAWKFKTDATLVILILMYIGLLSDIFDGIIARKQNCSTEKLRRLDSQVDMIFWVSIGISSCVIYPELINSNKYSIAFVFTMEGLCYLISLLKFRKETLHSCFSVKNMGTNFITGLYFYNRI